MQYTLTKSYNIETYFSQLEHGVQTQLENFLIIPIYNVLIYDGAERRGTEGFEGFILCGTERRGTEGFEGFILCGTEWR